MITSCQFRPQPHSSGMAATSARNGMATNTPTSTRWNVEVVSSAMSGRVGRTWVLVSGPADPLVAGVVSEVTWSVGVADGAEEIVASVALTVSGVAVIVLL